MAKSVVMSWSGGKDSALALGVMRGDLGVDLTGLLTTITEDYERISMHGVRVELLRAQVASIGLPVIEVWIPPGCTNEIYEARMAAAYGHPLLVGADAVASGDIFLEDVRAYREERIRGEGKEALFPIWGRASSELATSFIAEGFKAIITCVDPTQVDPAICGADFDSHLLSSLPHEVDPCGENGEFHTFVHDAPYFTEPVAIRKGELVERGGFFFRDLLRIGAVTTNTAADDLAGVPTSF